MLVRLVPTQQASAARHMFRKKGTRKAGPHRLRSLQRTQATAATKHRNPWPRPLWSTNQDCACATRLIHPTKDGAKVGRAPRDLGPKHLAVTTASDPPIQLTNQDSICAANRGRPHRSGWSSLAHRKSSVGRTVSGPSPYSPWAVPPPLRQKQAPPPSSARMRSGTKTYPTTDPVGWGPALQPPNPTQENRWTQTRPRHLCSLGTGHPLNAHPGRLMVIGARCRQGHHYPVPHSCKMD